MTPFPLPATGRHPLDPDPVRSTKAVAVLVLGVVAVLTAPLVGGLVPAGAALLLARQANADLAAGRGFLTGRRLVAAGRVLAWIAVTLAAAALVIAAVIGLLGLASAGRGFAPGTD